MYVMEQKPIIQGTYGPIMNALLRDDLLKNLNILDMCPKYTN